MKMTYGLLHHIVWQKFTDVPEVLAASIIRVIFILTAVRMFS
jgi:hypothetical protein